jgi:hypothetical protein
MPFGNAIDVRSYRTRDDATGRGLRGSHPFSRPAYHLPGFDACPVVPYSLSSMVEQDSSFLQHKKRTFFSHDDTGAEELGNVRQHKQQRRTKSEAPEARSDAVGFDGNCPLSHPYLQTSPPDAVEPMLKRRPPSLPEDPGLKRCSEDLDLSFPGPYVCGSHIRRSSRRQSIQEPKNSLLIKTLNGNVNSLECRAPFVKEREAAADSFHCHPLLLKIS